MLRCRFGYPAENVGAVLRLSPARRGNGRRRKQSAKSGYSSETYWLMGWLKYSCAGFATLKGKFK
jgi:hypothetical protein